MQVEPPPVPPDPDGSRNTSRQAASSRNRHVESDEPATESRKKKIRFKSPHASVQTLYTHPSFAEGPKGYSKDDKRTLLDFYTCPTSYATVLNLDPDNIVKSHVSGDWEPKGCTDGVKSVGRNRVSVEFSNAQAGNDFLSNQILTLTKYKAEILTFNITRMGLV
ncbi:unnamed protein product [Leptidea sinapis]|uniref:Uncharacterized protein n=1 Tax=Leptidea sinapis TaxID=189913 RepID=A0A5E4PR96_9NEOP|nr:unnamed protein product [Leptidea sinapis]